MKTLFFAMLMIFSASSFAANLPKGYFNWLGVSHYANGEGYYCYLNHYNASYRNLTSHEKMVMYTDTFEGRCEDGVSYNYHNRSFWMNIETGLYCKYKNYYYELPEMTRRDAQVFFKGPYYGLCNYE